MIYFNISEVRKYLEKHDEVYTLRKQRREGIDLAVTGNYFIHKPLFPVIVELIGKSSETLIKKYVKKSGMKSATAWDELAKRLSGKGLYMYHIRKV